jgi:hypothetical protein
MSTRIPTQAMTEALDDLAGIYGELYADWLRATTRLFEVLERQGREVGDVVTALPTIARLPAASCSREIPPPCWMPRELGERASHVCPGQTATICLRIVNCGASSRTVTVETGTDDDGVSITNSPLQLGAMEEGTVLVSYTGAADCRQGDPRRLLIWVRGCREHLLRWTVTVTVGRRATGSCHHVDVEDCPDHVHHWYDHFYCEHPCRATHG